MTAHCWISPREVDELAALNAINAACDHQGHNGGPQGVMDYHWAELTAVCMLEAGHAGEHEYTNPGEVFLSFAPAEVSP